MAPRTDWQAWHCAYEDPGSHLSARLVVVRRQIGDALDRLGPQRCRRILSLCAGEGRDLLPELAARPALTPIALLVELDPVLATRAERDAAELRLHGVRVAVADAGDTAVFAEVLPVDLLLLCGVFGNVADADVHGTLQAARQMVVPRGYLLWTRGRSQRDDLRPQVRRWSLETGFEEIAYDGEPAPYGVGLYRAPNRTPTLRSLPDQLFRFIR